MSFALYLIAFFGGQSEENGVDGLKIEASLRVTGRLGIDAGQGEMAHPLAQVV